ncbi:MAG: reprolysin-like metallopeptidase [Planctomycetota bacterium]
MTVQACFGAVTASLVVACAGSTLAQARADLLAGTRAVGVSADASWTLLDGVPQAIAAQPAYIRPDRFAPAVLDLAAVRGTLDDAPTEAAYFDGAEPAVIDLPMPDGGFDTFLVYETPIMSPGLRAKFPFMNTYAGVSVSDATATARITVTHHGFDAMVMRAGPDVYVDRYSMGNDSFYTSYLEVDLQREDLDFTCHVSGERIMRAAPAMEPGQRGQLNTPAASRGTSPTTLRTLETAITTTGEYTQFFGGTVADGQAAVVTAMNRVSGIYERELSCRFQLVPNNDQLIYTNPGSDPWPSNPNSLSQIDGVIDSIIGSSNFDVGHLVDTGSGGFAQLGVLCTGSKGRGYTGLTPPNNDRFYVDYLAHELGHQFAGNHTFNGDSGSCFGGNRSGSDAYEPGSGTTIMAYAGICGNDNVQTFSDDYFHFNSLNEMSNHLASRTCDVETATGNNEPIANAGFGIAVPLNTPFKLTGAGSDPNPGDVLTYTWEQADLGPQRDVSASDNGSSPIFRSFKGTTNPTRYFPNPADWRDGSLARGEKLPTVARTLDFILTVRDNNPAGGGYDLDSTTVQVVSGTSPFRVQGPNSPVTVTDGQLTVTWDVAGTDSSPFFESSVNILFSEDGAQTFPFVLASGTPNDGSETVMLPNISTTQGYVIVEAVLNGFWDMNKAPITVDIPAVPLEFTFPGGLPTTLTEGEATEFTVNIDPGSQGPINDASALLFYGYDIVGQPFLPSVMTPAGGNSFTATIPAGDCDQVASFYVTIANTDGDVFNAPADPTQPFQATVSDCQADECLADVNGDGLTSPADFSAWVIAFNAQAPECDQNGDGLCTPSDFSAWVVNFNAGCP